LGPIGICQIISWRSMADGPGDLHKPFQQNQVAFQLAGPGLSCAISLESIHLAHPSIQLSNPPSHSHPLALMMFIFFGSSAFEPRFVWLIAPLGPRPAGLAALC